MTSKILLRYFHGSGVPRDPAQAAKLFERGCTGGDMDACVSLGGIYLNGLGVPKQEARARQLLERGCTGGVKRACDFLK